jgi:hypothetical protein
VTKKDFVLIARTIKELALSGPNRDHVAVAFANALATTNPEFKRVTFLAACGRVEPRT